MTTPHKALLQQALDTLKHYCHGTNADERKPGGLIDRLQAAIDEQEPYDQQALELCDKCGWKAIVPGEPCLMCERNAKMLAPEPEPDAEPFGWYSKQEDDFMTNKIRAEHERLNSYTHKVGKYDVALYTHPAPRQPLSDMIAGWIRACDDEMISAHLGVANLSDSYASAKAKLRMLIDWHVAVATDPAVNGGYQLVPEGRKVTTTRIANHLKKSPLGDISMYRDGLFDGAKWAAAPKEPL